MSYFGEISEPSTRAAFEDWDDVTLKECYPELSFQSNIDPPAELATLLILEGPYLYNYVRDQNELEHINSVPAVNLHLYKTREDNNYVCVIKDYNLIQSSEIVELLKSYIVNSTDVVGILTKPLVEYQVSQLVTTDYVLRSLLTSAQIDRHIISKVSSLEQPNIVPGVIAGALCLREIIDKSAAAVVCYIDTDEQDIYEIKNILENFKVIPRVAKIKRNNLLNSNLYI